MSGPDVVTRAKTGCGGSGTCAIGMADLDCPNCPVEWGVRYRDGKVMKRPSKRVAEESVRLFPGRVLMFRVSDGWREAALREHPDALTNKWREIR